MESNRKETRLSPEEIDFLHQIVDLSLDWMSKNRDVDEPIVRFRTPKELEGLIDTSITDKGTGMSGILNDLKETMKYSVRTGHVRFFNQLWAGTDIPAVMGEWLTSVMNGSMYTYEVSPVFSLLEINLVEKLHSLI